jgi:hypothetical protein
MLVGSDQGPAMNAFYEHHRDSIRFGYRCEILETGGAANGALMKSGGG